MTSALKFSEVEEDEIAEIIDSAVPASTKCKLAEVSQFQWWVQPKECVFWQLSVLFMSLFDLWRQCSFVHSVFVFIFLVNVEWKIAIFN